ncbi:MAG: SusC/RagA family TonB-linked outer membrane protein [Lewinellaceae bacterium]|nr:SusC/RagA family TonB-linked outer membrane protein [Phaeodactylibacter sp.]MCB9038828.1 SusC/RagA family TonB-linked outer membrane protein [Lewinellaceae bacterium]
MKLKVDYVTKLLLLLAVLGLSNFAYAQRTITGTVTDAENGEPLIGANILVVGTSTGTITDFDGNYSVNVPADATTLEFSYTGYAAQRVEIGSRTTIDMSLSAGQILDEVVVVGYGTVKKSDLTGSVTSVKEEDFNKGVFTAPDQLIQGKVSGVQVLGNSGQPGAAATVRIRGNSSVRAGSTPLYVVDGVPLDGRSPRPSVSKDNDVNNVGDSPASNPLNFINPNDIASIEVLKDASATAIYGSRGANGVIIITTKRGRSGDPSIDFSFSAGASSILKKYDVLSASEYRNALNQYGITTGDAGGDVNAFDEILRTGITQNYNFSIGGGSDRGNYRVSAGYLDQEGIIKETGLKKYTGSINGSYKFLNDRLSVDFNLLASHTTENIEAAGSNADFRGNLISQALVWNPTDPLTNPDGSPKTSNFGESTINPLAMLDAYDDVSEITTILGSISPSFKIADGLEYRFLYSINHGLGVRRTQVKSFINLETILDRGFAKVANNALTTQQYTHTLSYNADLTSAVSLNAVVGYEYQEFNNRGFSANGKDFISDAINYTYAIQNSSIDSRKVTSFADPLAELQSYFGRANFNINNKYLVTGTVRADGSSKFGANNRYGVFPSVAVAWNISNEDFMSGGLFDQLKLRLGWGQTGNQEFPSGSAQERFSLEDDGGLKQENVANPDLQWETSTTINAGIDFALFDYKLSGSIEYFNKQDQDLLFNFQAIQPAPDTRYWINLPGTVTNSGVEVALNAFLLENENVSWQLGANASFLTNDLKDYNGPTVLIGELFGQGASGATSQRLANGQPLNAFYLREWLGIGEDGFNILRDDGNTLYFIGDPNPDVLLGISTSVNYRKLSVNLNFNGAFGHQIFNNTKFSVLPISNLGTRNIDPSLLGGGNRESTANPNTPSTRYLENGDYLKLANATVSYDFGNIGNSVKNIRAYITGQNLLVFTGFSGFDPEVNTVNERDGVPSFGIEYIPYPSARTILFGVNFSF